MLRTLIAMVMSATSPATPQTIPTETARDQRLTVSVHINDSGPYPFVVDTGAERTVISAELAARLGLPASAPVLMHSIGGISRVATVRIDRLGLSEASYSEIQAPTLSGVNLGAAGILGIDTLDDRRVVLDFRKSRMTIVPGRSAAAQPGPDGEIVVRARNRFGRLIVTDAEANGQKVHVIIDTGSQLTLGNAALAAKLVRRDRSFGMGTVDILTVTGSIVPARSGLLRKVRIGGVTLGNMPVAITDAHIFRALDLEHRPALLLGMDVLANFDRVSIDFADRTVRFLTPDTRERDDAATLPSGVPAS